MYQIKVLSSKEFDEVAKSDPRYAMVDDDNLGFADVEKKTAYVRYSVYPQLTKYLIDHEFEHLLEDEATDEDEYGIRHKKGKKFFKEIIAPFSVDPLGVFGISEGAFAPLNQPGVSRTDAFGNIIGGALSGFLGSGGNPLGAAAGGIGGAFSTKPKQGGFATEGPQFGGSSGPNVFDSFNPSISGGSLNSQASTQQGLNQGLFPGGSGLKGSSQPNISVDPRYKEYQFGSPFGRPYYF